MVSIPVQWRGIQFNLHLASAYYLGGVDPELQWGARSVSGNTPDAELSQALKKQQAEALIKLNSDAITRRKAQVFVDECAKVMDGLVSKGGSFLKNYLGRRDYKFILGAMRTGGTYLYKELSEIYGQPWRKLNMEMTHDSIPTYIYLTESAKPEAYLATLFDFTQYFVWMRRELNSDVVVQKRIAYSHILPIMNALFGDQAEYVISVRHPIPIAYSFAQVGGHHAKDQNCPEPSGWNSMVNSGVRNFDPSAWRDLNYFERVLYYWERYHVEIANNIELLDNVNIIPFGESMSDFISQRAVQSGINNHDTEMFSASERAFDGELPEENLSGALDYVSRLYQAKDIAFPKLKII